MSKTEKLEELLIANKELSCQIAEKERQVAELVIAQTACAFSGNREKVIEAGCNDYITKPINHTLLKKLINKHCYK